MTLDEQQAICDAAAPGPWEMKQADADGTFFSAARTEWPALIEEHRKALAEIERLREAMRVGCRAMGWPEDGSWLVHARESAAQIERLRRALLDLLPGLSLAIRMADPDEDDMDALRSRVETITDALEGK